MRRSYFFPVLATFWSVVVVAIVINLLSTEVQNWIDSHKEELWLYAPWIALTFVILLGWTLWEWQVYRTHQASQEFKLFKPATALLPEDLQFQSPQPGTPPDLSQRPYPQTYIPRSAVSYDASPSSAQPPMSEQMLENALRAQKNIVLIGPPTEGKTRTLFEIIKRMEGYHVVTPKGNALPSDAAFALCKKRQLVLSLDNLNDYANGQVNLAEFTAELRKQAASVVVAATCRDGAEFGTVQGAFGTGLQRFYTDITSKGWKLRLVRASPAQKRRFAQGLGKSWQAEDDERFPTLGSIVMEDSFKDMRARLDALRRTCAAGWDALRVLKLLTAAEILPHTLVRLHAVLRGIFDRELRSSELNDCLRTLTEQAFLRQGKSADAIEPEPAYLEQVVLYERHDNCPDKDFPALIPIMEGSKDVEALLMLGRKFLLSSEVDHARACFTVALHLDATLPTQLHDEADRLYDEKHYKEAVEVLGYLLLLEPQNTQTWHNKGVGLGELGQYDEALAAFEQAIKLKPDYPEAWHGKGHTLDTLGRQEGAQTAFERTAQIADDPDLLSHIASLLEARGAHLVAAQARIRAAEMECKKAAGR